MSIFQLKGDILSYVYDNATATPSSDYSRQIGFSSSLTSMSVGSVYTMYIKRFRIK